MKNRFRPNDNLHLLAALLIISIGIAQILAIKYPEQAKSTVNQSSETITSDISSKTDELIAAFPTAFIKSPNAGENTFITENKDYEIKISPEKISIFLYKEINNTINKTNIDFRFLNSNKNANSSGLEKYSFKSNYYIGDDQSKWTEQADAYKKANIENLFNDVDMVFHGDDALKFDFIVHPGGFWQDIKYEITGAQNISLNENKDLVLLINNPEKEKREETAKKNTSFELIKKAPFCYQQIDNKKTKVNCEYNINNLPKVSYTVSGNYNPEYDLIIDPGLSYSSFAGTVDREESALIRVDSVGNYYILVNSKNILAGHGNITVYKLDPAGTLLYTTTIGGNNSDIGAGMELGTSHLYFGGITASSNYPAMPLGANPYPRTTNGKTDFIVTKLNQSDLTMTYSTHYGGPEDDGTTSAQFTIDSNENLYLAGSTMNGGLSGHGREYYTGATVPAHIIAKLNSSGSTLDYVTYTESDIKNINELIVDNNGHALIAGSTDNSTGYTTTPLAYDSTYNGGTTDGYIWKVNSDASNIVYSTFFGGSDTDTINTATYDNNGNLIFGGETTSSNIPTITPAHQESKNNNKGYISKLNLIEDASEVIDIDMGWSFSLALKNNGTVWMTGWETGGSTNINFAPVQVPGLTNVIAIDTGIAHAIALKSDGTVWTWGYNYYGQLGTGNYTDSISPIQVTGLTNVIGISSGYYSNLAVKNDGTVWAWGANFFGQLGNGTTTTSNIPVQVSGLTGIQQASMGIYHGSAVKGDGTVWSWGYNYYGQLGLGDKTTRKSPVQIPGLTGVSKVNNGIFFSMALKNDGTVWSWGYNYYGNLGFGNFTDTTTPLQITTLTNVRDIEAGNYSAMALKNDGTLWAWGWNLLGQLCTGDFNKRNTPTQITGITGGPLKVSSDNLSTMILQDNGIIMACGQNPSAEFGNNDIYSKFPIQVSTAGTIMETAYGYSHGIILKSDGTVWNTGWEELYITDGGVDHIKEVPQQDPTLNNIISVHAGPYRTSHSLALKNDGTVWAWGYNWYGKLGDGGTNSTLTPVQSAGLTNMINLDAGAYHSIGLKNDGTVWTWGDNSNGQLGNGTTIGSKTAIQVPGFTGMSKVKAGYYHSLALKNDGTVWAWGANNYGQLGDGTTTRKTSPVQTNTISGITAIDTTGEFSIALKNDGTVWTWGKNNYGQLGNGNTTDSINPIQVPGLTNIIAIATGIEHSIALKSDGTVWTWGRNTYGQLGDGTLTDSTTPVQVTGLTDVVKITGGDYSSHAIKSNGTAWGWGINSFAQLANSYNPNSPVPIRAMKSIIFDSILSASTYIRQIPENIVTDSTGDIYISGGTTNGIVTTQGSYKSSTPNCGLCGYITKLPDNLSTQYYSSYLLGNESDSKVTDFAIRNINDLYLAGITYDTYDGNSDFPVTTGAFDTTFNGGYADAFFSRLETMGGSYNLQFVTQPVTKITHEIIPVSVELLRINSNTGLTERNTADNSSQVTLSLSSTSPPGTLINNAVTAIAGLANFSTFYIDGKGQNYSLEAKFN